MTTRRLLSNRRRSENFGFDCGGFAYVATISRFPDGSIAEFFLNGGKLGSSADTAARDSAVIASIALQHGVTITTMRGALLRDSRGRPNGPLGAVLDMLAAGAAAPTDTEAA